MCVSGSQWTSMCRLVSPTRSSSTKQNKGVHDNSRSTILVSRSMPDLAMIWRCVLQSGPHPYLLALASGQTVTSQRRYGTGGEVRFANPRRKEQLCPLVRGLPPSLLFVPRLPPASGTAAISCPPHWWRAADIARAYLLKGLPWRLAVVVSQEERARESSIYCGESWRGDKKERKRKHGLRSRYLVNGFQRTHLGETSVLPPARVRLEGGEEFTQAPHESDTPCSTSSLMSNGWKPEKGGSDPRSAGRVPDSEKHIQPVEAAVAGWEGDAGYSKWRLSFYHTYACLLN